jgi:hypothetical protein
VGVVVIFDIVWKSKITCTSSEPVDVNAFKLVKTVFGQISTVWNQD